MRNTPLGFIYDLDDTLLDNHPAEYAPHNIHEVTRVKATREVGERLNVPALREVTYEQNLHSVKTSVEHSMDGVTWSLLLNLGLVEGEIDRQHHLVRAIIEEKDKAHFALMSEVCRPVKGASDFITAVHAQNKPQAIASGASPREIEIFLQANNLSEYFDTARLFGRGMYPNAKPHPDSFDAAFLSLGLDDTEQSRAGTIAFEDDPKGVASAKQAGLRVCGVKTRFTEEQFRDFAFSPDFFVDTFEDILTEKRHSYFTF